MALRLQPLARTFSHGGASPFVASRNMSTLKELRYRMKSVSSVKKITSSMKAVAASKLKAAERRMIETRPFFNALSSINDFTEVPEAEVKGKVRYVVAVAGDRGLCGAVNGSIVRAVQKETKDGNEADGFVLLGEKVRAGLERTHRDKFTVVATTFDARPVCMGDVIPVAETIMNLDPAPEVLTVYRNHFVNVMTFDTISVQLRSVASFCNSGALSEYNFEDDVTETLRDIYEFYTASFIYTSLVEHSAAEQAQRMVSMESATNNASDLYDGLNLKYNKGRQASITKELIEIVSGQEALSTEED